MAMDRRWKTSAEIAPNCPRCASPNTKFCYYNNYSLSQPRYFCKGCRRYWTRGGSLRNVPVGGGCRKNRRSKSSTRNFSSSDRPSFNSYLSDGVTANSTVLPPSSTTTTTSTASPTNNTASATDVSNIDLGVVFAKFLNQTPVTSYNLGNNNQVDSPFSLTDSSSSSSSSSTSSSDLPQFPEQQVQQAQQPRQTQQSRIDMIEYGDLGVDQDLNFIGNYEEFGLEDHQASMIAAPYAEFTDPNAYRLQSMWMDDFSQSQPTSLWPGTAPETVSPNVSWQTSQIHGLDSVVMTPSADHHLTFHPNVLLNNEICSSFDLSGYGITSSSCF